MSGCRLARKWSNRFSVIFLSWSFSRFIMTRNKLADGNLNLDLFYFKLDGPNLSWFLLPEEWRHFSWCRYLYTNSTQVFFAMEKSCELRLCAAPFTFVAINNFQHSKFSPREIWNFFAPMNFFSFFKHVRRWGWLAKWTGLITHLKHDRQFQMKDHWPSCLLHTPKRWNQERKRIFSTTLLCVIETGIWLFI